MNGWFGRNWRWAALFIMIGIIMYWTATLIQPVIEILENQNAFVLNNSKQIKANLYIAEIILNNLTQLQNDISSIDITQNITNIENQLDEINTELDHILLNITNATR